MIRTITVEKETTLEALTRDALKARTRDSQAEAALTRFKDLNPDVDPDRLTAGAVLIVPDVPGLKASAADAVTKAPWTELKTLVQAALGEAAQSLGAGIESRIAARSEMAKRLKSAAFKKTLNASDLPNTLAKDATQSMGEDDKRDRDAAERLQAMSSAAMEALARLEKILP